MYKAGIETHRVDNLDIRVYGAAKTVVDCFRFRNKIGLDIAIEALKFFRAHKKFSTRELLNYARRGRVERVMRPYLETLS